MLEIKDIQPPPHFELMITQERDHEGLRFSVSPRASYLAYCRYIRLMPIRYVTVGDDEMVMLGWTLDENIDRPTIEGAFCPHGSIVTISWTT